MSGTALSFHLVSSRGAERYEEVGADIIMRRMVQNKSVIDEGIK